MRPTVLEASVALCRSLLLTATPVWRLVVLFTLFMACPGWAFAQVLMNGGSADITINRGDAVTINAQGTTRNDWVGLYAIGASDQTYQDWFYLNGTKALPSATISAAQFSFLVKAPAGSYEFRLFRGSYNFAARSGGVTVAPLTISIDGVVAPLTATAEPSGSIQLEVTSGPGNNTSSWVGLFRVGSTNSTYFDWFYLNGTKTLPSVPLYGGSFPMTLPAARGPYEVRLFGTNANTSLIATSTSIASEISTPIAAGQAHTLVARPSGTVLSAGNNSAGQLGEVPRI